MFIQHGIKQIQLSSFKHQIDCSIIKLMPTCDFVPGVIGLSGLFMSHMNISESLAPEASRFFYAHENNSSSINLFSYS